MTAAVDEMLELLNLECLEQGIYRGPSRNIVGKNVFGGQVLGQALMAAGRTVDGRFAHSIHGYFLRAGDIRAPIVYLVERLRDGRSFSNRQVKAVQHGEVIFMLMASFVDDEDGLEHQSPMPNVEGPEGLPSETELRARMAHLLPEKIRESFSRDRPIEIRPIQPVNPFAPQPQEADRAHWMRAQTRLPNDRLLHQCILAFASDFALMGTAMLPHGVSFMQPNIQAASLDHAMWFHKEFRADDWLLYHMDSPRAAGGRGINRGRVYRQDGTLVATVAQEGLMRLREVAEKY